MNNLLKKENELWVPFNEAIIKGNPVSSFLSDGFLKERYASLNTDEKEYFSKMGPFIKSLETMDYDEIDLWFGNEPFCIKNREYVINLIKKKDYRNRLILHIMDEKEEHEVKTVILQEKKQ